MVRLNCEKAIVSANGAIAIVTRLDNRKAMAAAANIVDFITVIRQLLWQ
jgi:hypothetical protein